ncbi:galactoside-binding lectin [Oesophagostomum dentatum]|uniref:Galectin n=1 Tax=Oesophagostomum dentatum TaxID=61180 RepID=A0A0B1TKW7_OESDE|nr:galactoside-binding lectin [Oesophagostomum dentatum]
MEEERVPLPYKPGESFSVRLRVTENGYEIWCNDKMVHTYEHRFPFNRVEYLEVTGDNVVSMVEWFGAFDLPYEGDIPGGALKLNHYCEVEGIPKGTFDVNLFGENGDILFHFKPRFIGRGGIIIRNSHIDGSWNNEEINGEFPFKTGQSFILRFQNEYQDIQV